jgi:hypothetical protein
MDGSTSCDAAYAAHAMKFWTGKFYTAWIRASQVARRIVRLALVPCALAGFAAAPVDSRILFARDTNVPGPVQQFAWWVIETRCNYQRYELEQRRFWAYDTAATKVDAGVAYRIKILSERDWRKTEPPATIEMTIEAGKDTRLTALKSSFVVCTP